MKRIMTVLLALSMVLVLGACNAMGDGEYPVHVADMTFNESPSSVVCLSDSIADILIACGYSDRITARSEECTQEELSEVSVVGTKDKPNVSKIKEISPSVVFTDKTVSSEAVKSLREEGITVMNMIFASDSDELTLLYENLSAVMSGEKTGRENGEKKAKNIFVTMDDLQRIIPETDVVPTACYLYNVKGEAADGNTFSGKLFSYANAVNVCGGEDSNKSNAEIIKLSNPQYVFCDKGVKAELEKSEDFKKLSAVKQGRVYEIESNLFERQGSSITQVLSFIIETIYPETVSGKNDNAENSGNAENSENPQNTESSKSEDGNKGDNQESNQESQEEGSTVKADNSLDITDTTAYGQGDENEDIMKIQKRLKELGYYDSSFTDDDLTNYFGELTAGAFRAFEKNNSLEEDGYASTDDLRLLFSDKVKANS